MRIVGITGVSGSGKTTLGAYLAAALLDAGYTSKLEAFALPLREAARQEFGYFDKARHRAWLQNAGAKWRQSHPDLFVNFLRDRNPRDRSVFLDSFRMFHSEDTTDFLIITDVRYRNEAEYCAGNGLLIMREGCRTPLAPAQAKHISESGVVELLPLCQVVVEQQPDLDHLAAWVADLVATNPFFDLQQPICNLSFEGIANG